MLTDKLKKPSDLFELPWDDQKQETEKPKQLTKEEQDAIFAKWEKKPPGKGTPLNPTKELKKLMK